MDVCHYVFQFWRCGDSALDDRLMYEILATDAMDARDRLCQLLGVKRVPSGLTIRITHAVMSID